MTWQLWLLGVLALLALAGIAWIARSENDPSDAELVRLWVEENPIRSHSYGNPRAHR